MDNMFGGKRAEASSNLKVVGLLPVQIVAINPTKEEADKIYGADTKEPTYFNKDVQDKNGGDTYDSLRYSFVLKFTARQGEVEGITGEPKDIFINQSFFVKSIDKKPGMTSGKYLMVNNKVQTTWALNPEAPDTPDWMSKDGIRRAKDGEVELYEFLSAWFGFIVGGDETVMNMGESLLDWVSL